MSHRLIVVDTDNITDTSKIPTLFRLFDSDRTVFRFFCNGSCAAQIKKIKEMMAFCKGQVDLVIKHMSMPEQTDIMICDFLGKYHQEFDGMFAECVIVSGDKSLYKMAIMARHFFQSLHFCPSFSGACDSWKKVDDVYTSRKLNCGVPLLTVKSFGTMANTTRRLVDFE